MSGATQSGNKGGAHLVSSFMTPEFGCDVVRIGDLNGDGAPDLLFTQTVHQVKPGTNELLCRSNEVSCLTATTITGEVLWQYGAPSLHNGCTAGDPPVQIYDWDNDGVNEVVFIRRAVYAELYPEDDPAFRGRAKRYGGTATLVALDGRTGKEKVHLPLPAPADGVLLFADLTGRGRREDLVVKDTFGENVFGISRTGDFLWHWHGGPWPVAAHNMESEPLVFVDDPKCEAGHYPAIADIDGDGRDEVFFGFALLDHDGRVLFRKDTGGGGHHSDANYIVRLDDDSWRLLFGNHGVHCLDVEGNELWSNQLTFGEAQHVVAGRFRDDSPLQVAVMDRAAPRVVDSPPSILYLFDLDTGKELWQRPQFPGGWAALSMDIYWSGRNDLKDILVSGRGVMARDVDGSVAIYNGCGEIVDEITVPAEIVNGPENVSAYEAAFYSTNADVYGDSREELIISGRNGVHIYANSRPLAVPSLYNATLYRGM